MHRRACFMVLLLALLGIQAHASSQDARSAVFVERSSPEQTFASCGSAVGPRFERSSDSPAGPFPEQGWQRWWYLNREPYLDLKRIVFSDLPKSDLGCCFGPHENATPDPLRPSAVLLQLKVVPALISTLRREASNDVATWCLLSLAKIGASQGEGGPDLSEEIRSWLASPAAELQASAAMALGILGSERDIPCLAAVLQDDLSTLRGAGIRIPGPLDRSTRASAAHALGLIATEASPVGRRAIVSALVATLEQETRFEGRRDVSVACLNALGLSPLPCEGSLGGIADLRSLPLPVELTTLEDQVGWASRHLLDDSVPSLDRAQVPIALGRLLQDVQQDAWIRAHASELLLAQLAARPAVDRAIRQSCILALGKLGDCDADVLDVSIRDALATAARSDDDEQSRHFALIALAQVASRPGAGHGDPLWGLIGRYNARGLLIERLRRGSSHERCWAALALAVLERGLEDRKSASSSDGKSALREALGRAASPEELGACAIALGMARAVEAREILRDKFKVTHDAAARGQIALGLGMLNDRLSISELKEVLRATKFQPQLFDSIATALALMGDKEVVPELVGMLATAHGLSSQAAMSAALGRLADCRSLDPLIALLEDEDKTYRARGLAASALGDIIEGSLPWHERLSSGANFMFPAPILTCPETWTGVLDVLR